MRKLIRVWAALAMVLLFAGIALAQDTGRLDGEILDKDGKPYPDVNVEIKSVGHRANVQCENRQGREIRPARPASRDLYDLAHQSETTI